VFRRTAVETGGELLEMDDHWPRPGHRAAPHVHPEMEERWEVIAGGPRFRIGADEIAARPGDVVVAPAGVTHLAWNPGSEPVHMRIQMRPALRWEEFVRKLFALGHEGWLDENGVPEPAILYELLREYKREIAPPVEQTA